MPAGLLLDVDNGLNIALNMLAAYLSAEGPNPITVRRDESNGTRVRSLSGAVPFPVSYGVSGARLVVAGSPWRLKQTLESKEEASSSPRLADHSGRFFAGANQRIWLDAVRTRQVLAQHHSDLSQMFAQGSSDEASRLAKRFEQIGQHLGLLDSLFVAGSD